MRPYRFVSSHPVAALAAVAVAFTGWVAADTLAPPEREAPEDQPLIDPAAAAWSHAYFRLGPEERQQMRVGRAIQRLRIGMPRAEAEQWLLGAGPLPEAPDGRLRYAAILGRPLAANPAVSGPCDVTVVFDLAAPGQPLLRFECSPR